MPKGRPQVGHVEDTGTSGKGGGTRAGMIPARGPGCPEQFPRAPPIEGAANRLRQGRPSRGAITGFRRCSPLRPRNRHDGAVSRFPSHAPLRRAGRETANASRSVSAAPSGSVRELTGSTRPDSKSGSGDASFRRWRKWSGCRRRRASGCWHGNIRASPCTVVKSSRRTIRRRSRTCCATSRARRGDRTLRDSMGGEGCVF